MKVLPFALLAVLAAIFTQSSASGRVVCYYSSWAVYRTGPGNYNVELIDPSLCTHIIYSFIGLQNDGQVELLDPWNDEGDEWHEGQFTKFQKVKKDNPDIKVLLAIGGFNHGPAPFQQVVVKPERRQKFIDTSIALIKKWGLDGLDIDWEYQDQVGGTPDQLQGFSDLLREMSAAFHEKDLLLSAATAANFNLIEANYDLEVMSETLDFINVMAYDLHGSWETVTGHLAPLHARKADTGDELNLNVEAVINRYIERGADPEKINLGLVTYGRSFTLADPDDHDIGSPATGPGNMGDVIPENGNMAYGELCQGIAGKEWERYWDEEQAVPYAVNGNQWVGYEDAESLKEKIAFAKSKGIGGAMVWSLETDDFSGNCADEKYEIIRFIKNNI